MTDPSLTLPHSLALTPWYTHLKHWHSPQGLVAPQVPDNANLVPARAEHGVAISTKGQRGDSTVVSSQYSQA